MPATPPRRRSLYIRGYDRPPLEGRHVSEQSNNSGAGRIVVAFLTFILASFALFFAAGYHSARQTQVGLAVPESVRPNNQNVEIKRAQEPEVVIVDTVSNTASLPSFKRLNIAIAVTVTRDGPYLDGAAVLQHSVRMTRSRHHIDMVAIVHSEVQTTRPALKALGFKILEFPPPIVSQEIKGKHLRDTIDKSGCCGALELLKLCAWKLEEYDRVVSMDMDAIWLQSLDHLFERDIPRGGFLFTYDFAMDNAGSRAPPVQGGFIVVRPSLETYNRLIGIVREGDFRPSTGWGGSHIGWCWGGQTVQGLLAYFAVLVEPGLAFPLDPCEYNSMASTKVCRRVDYGLVKSIHYTVCQKPWECRQGDNSICAKFLHAWWMIRNDLERLHNLPPTERCCGARSKYCPVRSYAAVNIERMTMLPMSDPSQAQSLSGQTVVIPEDLPSRDGSSED